VIVMDHCPLCHRGRRKSRGGVAAAIAKSGSNNMVLESLAPIDSSYAPQNCKTCSSLMKGANVEVDRPIAKSSSDHASLVTVALSPPTPTPIRENTLLAAFNRNTSNIQPFYKRTDGSIRAREKDGLRWKEESQQITNLNLKDDSGLATTG